MADQTIQDQDFLPHILHIPKKVGGPYSTNVQGGPKCVGNMDHTHFS